MVFRVFLSAALLLTALPAPALAQTAPPPASPAADSEISVTADRLRREQLRAQAQAYIAAALQSAGGHQHARWTQAVCAKAVGVSPAAGQIFTDRVAAVARFVGVPVARPGCTPNIALVFTPAPIAMMAAINKREHGSLDTLPEAERVQLQRKDLVVRWWHFTREDAYDGKRYDTAALGGSAQIPLAGDLNFNSSARASRIREQTQTVITGAVVLVDTGRIGTVDVAALVDHVAMAAMAKLKLNPDGRPKPSIMGLFDPAGPRVAGFTAEDEAFLDAYYHSDADGSGFEQRVQMAGLMTKAALTGAKPETKNEAKTGADSTPPR
ncbi:MAG: hypothetical protein WCO11_02640 [Sphingomonadales bacterium]|jgi:hypothetical protein